MNIPGYHNKTHSFNGVIKDFTYYYINSKKIRGTNTDCDFFVRWSYPGL